MSLLSSHAAIRSASLSSFLFLSQWNQRFLYLYQRHQIMNPRAEMTALKSRPFITRQGGPSLIYSSSIPSLLAGKSTTLSTSVLLLSTPQRKRLISWATFSSLTRDIPRKELPRWLGWTCGEKAVRTAFKKEGYCRCIRRRTPPISPKNQRLRLEWAQEHLN